MRVLFASSEAHPLIKTGGLADVAGALPPVLQSLGCDMRLVIPAYPAAKKALKQAKIVSHFYLPGVAGQVVIKEGMLPNTHCTVWLVDYPPAFARRGNPYLGDDGEPWPDNAERFALFSRVVHALAMNQAGLGWRAEIVHCNDWQTALVPALLSLEGYRPATLFTIHNLAYQGLFPAASSVRLGLPDALWGINGLEFHGQLSFIKGGLVYADRINTVSPRYAQEIQTPEFGCGLDGLLRHRRVVLSGIVNGIDDQQWNPNNDPYLSTAYTAKDFRGKAKNKQALQQHLGLPVDEKLLLLGLVGRLVEQKGIDLLLDNADNLRALPIQLALLGSGHAKYETALRDLASRYPASFGIQIGYDEKMAHQIEAGADAFIMPSRFEPCGLNQLYSLRYGTPPIVHRVGGLADTVIDADKQNLRNKTATGFVFDQPTAEALMSTLHRALTVFADKPLWQQLMQTGMTQKVGWASSAQHYLALYNELMKIA